MTDYAQMTDCMRAARRAASPEERAWLKIKLNSELPLVGGVPIFYDPSLTAKVTEAGQQNLRNLMEQLGDEAADQESLLQLDDLSRRGS